MRKQRRFWEFIQPGATVYDLGAHAGFYSLLASVAVGSEGTVVSFEPSPRNLKFLRRHLELNRISNCRVYNAAVSDEDGEVPFELGSSPYLGGISSVAAAGITVRCLRLDTLISAREVPPPAVIKCDIEGAEYRALQGARRLLSEHRPVIFLATHGPQIP
jgi:FkbM family methyltransferase